MCGIRYSAQAAGFIGILTIAVIVSSNAHASDVVVSGAVRSLELRQLAGAPFFEPCALGSAIRSIAVDGTVTCQSVEGSGDDLGNHLATQNIQLNGNLLSGDGDDEGIWISSAGNVGIGNFDPQSRLHVSGDATFDANANLAFGTTATRISESSGNLTLFAHSNDNSDIHLSAEENIELDAEEDIFLLADLDIHIEPGNLGGVGIGNVNNPSNILTVEQGSTTDPIADAWTTYSSIRWKSDIDEISEPSRIVSRLRGVRYRSSLTGEESIGLIAEEVAHVLPEIVDFDPATAEARGIDYARIVAVLVEAHKDLQQEVRGLRQHMAEVVTEHRRCEGLPPE